MSKVRKAQTQELIPYNGADQAIDLGAQNVTTTGTITAGLFAGPGGGGGAVSSVNSQTGVVVLDTDDIDEGSINLYFSDELAQDAIGSILADLSSSESLCINNLRIFKKRTGKMLFSTMLWLSRSLKLHTVILWKETAISF